MEPRRRLQIVLTVAAVATLIVLFGIFPVAVRVACLVLLAGLAVAAWPLRDTGGPRWWPLLAAGVALSIVAALVAQAAQTLGGILAVAAALLVLGAAVIGLGTAGAD